MDIQAVQQQTINVPAPEGQPVIGQKISPLAQPPQSSENAPEEKKNKSFLPLILLILTILLIVGGAIAYFFVLPQKGVLVSLLSPASIPALTQFTKTSLAVQDQPVGESIFVDNVTLSEGGYVFIFVQNKLGKPSTLAVAVSEYLWSGEHKNLSIDLVPEDARQGAELKPGLKLFATIYEDSDGDTLYTEGKDLKFKDANGEEILIEFSLI